MPSANVRKRSRRATFEDDADVEGNGVVIASASSSLRNENQRKRARHSAAGPSKVSARSRREKTVSSSDDDEVMQEPEESEPPPATQYEMMRDAGFRHLDHVKEDDQRATQRLKNRRRRFGDNRESLNAVLESITCYNFMCHIRLHCELGPLLNFIVGENGSGKSAILTAITLCLGGKASSTNRGGSLRSFIKEGEDHANLVVKIKNQGDGAYKPDVFGDSIIVERHFSKSGSSGFKLKDSSGKRVVSTKKGDVDDVVEYYCLQVDNPLNVLSQDNARQFLNSSSPSTKYKFFLQGTQLEQLDHDLGFISEILDLNEAKLIQFNENVDALKERYEKARKLRETCAKNDEMRLQLKVYRNQLVWAQVVDQETILQERENDVTVCGREIESCKQQIDEKSANLERCDNQVQLAEAASEQVKQEGGELEEKETEANTNWREANTALSAMVTQERDLREQVKQANNMIEKFERDLQGEEKSLAEANGGALAEGQRQRDQAKQLRDELKNQIAQHNEGLSPLQEKFEEAEKEVQKAGEPVQEKVREINSVKSHIRSLSQNRSDPLDGYEPQVRQLLKIIDEDREFQQKPIGPLGTLVQLTKPAWSSILETYLGPTLNSFLVVNKQDQQRLSRHMDRLKIRGLSVYISRPGLTLNNLREPDENFETILRVLRFDDVRVRNQMIIANSIEQILLIRDREHAERVMFSEQPKNVSTCLAFHDKKRGHGVKIAAGRNLSTSPVTPSHAQQKPRMKSDGESQINLHKENLAHLESELQQLEAAKQQREQVVKKCAQAVTQHKRQAAALESRLRGANADIEKLEGALDKFEGIGMRLQGLRDQVAEAKANEVHYGQQFAGLRSRKEEQTKAVEVLRREYADVKAQRQKFHERVRRAEDKVNRMASARRIALEEKNHAYHMHEMAKQAEEEAKHKRDRQIRNVQEMTEAAAQASPERVYIPEGETYQIIEQKFSSIKEQLAKFRNQVGLTEEQINKQFIEADEQFRTAKNSQKQLTKLLQVLKDTLVNRLAKWRQFQRLISAHSRTHFEFLLSERGFKGKLLLDHQRKKLEIQVEPDSTRKSVSGRNTKTLSGGEKSFSSICLLLAIWDAMGSPLRCLDEFDVFMDNVNRAISTNMLVDAARSSVGKQFILITPNAIEGRAKIDKDVKIIRLTDPRQKLLADH